MKKFVIILLSLITSPIISQNLNYVVHDIGGVTYKNCGAIGEDINGNIYVGEQSGDYFVFNGQNWTTLKVPTNETVGKINCIAFDKSNVGFFVVEDDGIHINTNGVWTKYDNSNSVLPTSFEASGIEYDSDKDIMWISTFDHGLVKIQSDVLEILNKSNSEIPTNFIDGMSMDLNNDIWFIDWDQSLIHFNGESFSEFKVIDQINGGFFDGVNSLDVTPENDIVIAYSDGYVLYDGVEFSILDGFTEEMDFVKVDYNGNIWGTDKKDLFFFDNIDVVQYNQPVTPEDFVQNLFVSRENDVWVIGQGDHPVIQIDQMEVSTGQPTIEKIKVNLYPNPTSGTIHLPQSFPTQTIHSIHAIDALGAQHEIRIVGDRSLVLPGIPGLYTITIELEDGTRHSGKVMVQD